MSISKRWKSLLVVILSFGIFCLPNHATAQYFNQWFTVDCSGNTSWAYPSINSVIPLLTDRSGIYLVPGTTCNESVNLNSLSYIWLGTDPGAIVNLNGTLSISDSDWIYVQSVNVHSESGDGISVDNSRDVRLDACLSSNNVGNGLTIGNASSVTVQASGTYDFNAGYGISVGLNSTLSIMAWGGLIDISNNIERGLSVDRSVFQSLGNVSINNNDGDFGLDMEGGSRGLIIPVFGPNTVSVNPYGGVHIAENSQLSIGGGDWASFMNIIQGNGPIGISATQGGQLTLFGKVQVQDHTGVGVDLGGNSQVTIFMGLNQITHNGFGTGAARAGIRIDGESQAYVRGAAITQNGGPGILELVNSSLDIAGSTLSSNAGGAVACDGSSFIVGDLTSSVLSSASSCKIPAASGAQHKMNSKVIVPNWRQQKAYADRIHSLVAKMHH